MAKLGTAARNAAADGVVDRVDAGSAAGRIEFFTGVPPANPAAADTGTKLATTPMSDPAFGNAGASVAGQAAANAITSDMAVDTSGTPGHFRIKDSDNLVVMQGTVTATGGGGDITFNSVSWVADGTVSISSLTWTQPEGT